MTARRKIAHSIEAERSSPLTEEIRRVYEGIMQAKRDAAPPASAEQEQLVLWRAAQADALETEDRSL